MASGGTLKAVPPALKMDLSDNPEAHPLSLSSTTADGTPTPTTPKLGSQASPRPGTGLVRRVSGASPKPELASPRGVGQSPLFPEHRPESPDAEETQVGQERLGTPVKGESSKRAGTMNLKREDTVKGPGRLRGSSVLGVQGGEATLKGKGKAMEIEEETLQAHFRYSPEEGAETLKVSLSDSPHRLDLATLLEELQAALARQARSLTSSQLALLLVQQLSASETSQIHETSVKDAEVAALVELLTKTYGAGEGEVDRCRVRARAGVATANDKDTGKRRWEQTVPFLASDETRQRRVDDSPPSRNKAAANGMERARSLQKHRLSMASAMLDLDLQEAMSETGFDARSLSSVISNDALLPSSSIHLDEPLPDSASTASAPAATVAGSSLALPPAGSPQQTPTPASRRVGTLGGLKLWGGSSSPSRSSSPASVSAPVTSKAAAASQAAGASVEVGAGEGVARMSRSSSVSSFESVTSGNAGPVAWLGWRWGDRKGSERTISGVQRGRAESEAVPPFAEDADPAAASISSTSIKSATSSSTADQLQSSVSTSPDSGLPPPRSTGDPKTAHTSPTAALLSKWGPPESSAAITTAPAVQPSFSRSATKIPESPESSAQSPKPSHFVAVADAAARWVSASGVMDGLLERKAHVQPRIHGLAQDLLTSVTLNADRASADVGAEDESGPPPSSKVTITPNGLLSPTLDKLPTTVRRVSASAVTLSAVASAADAKKAAAASKPKGKGYFATAKGTLGRALGFNLAAAASAAGKSGSSTPAQPNVTVPTVTFRRLAPAAPSMTLSPSQASLKGLAAPKSGAEAVASQPTMELDTIGVIESKPPTLMGAGEIAANDGKPVTDRYGFIIDVKTGIKQMREARKKHQNTEMKPDGKDDDDDTGQANPTTALPIKSQIDVEAELESLREALGLSPVTSPTVAKTEAEAIASVDDGVQMTNQSVRRLLGQLGEMQEALEKTQFDAWDSFIRKRQAKAKHTRTTGVSTGGAGLTPTMTGDSDGMAAAVLLGKGNGARDSICHHDDNLIGVATMGATGKQGKEDWKEFKDLVRKGVPVALRPRIWAECSGATERREPGYYMDLLSAHAAESGLALAQIECDVTRTLPTNVYFGGDGPGVDKLRRVLAAMSWHNPVVGYCQGMNMVAGTLLLTLPTEEDAFWVLACIIERILPSDYYTSYLLVSQADQRVLRDLVETWLPDLAAHFKALDIELPAITFGWFLSLFADALPMPTLLRVLDLFLIEGTIILFRTALALLSLHSSEILSHDSAATLYAYMRGSMTLGMHHSDRLIRTACGKFGDIKGKAVGRMRETHVLRLRREMGLDSSPSRSGAKGKP